MNIIENFNRIKSLIEADLGVNLDDEEGGSSKSTFDVEKERRRLDKNAKGGSLAPAAKYATGLQNFGDVLPRTGEGDRPKASAAAVSHINDLMKLVHDFIEEHGDIAISRKTPPKKDDDEKEKTKSQPVEPEDKFHKLKKEKVISLLNTVLDPQIGPDRRTPAINVFWAFLKSINIGRKEAFRQKVKDAFERTVQTRITLVKNELQKRGKTVSDEDIVKRVTMKTKQDFQFKLGSKEKQEQEKYAQESEIIKRAVVTISNLFKILKQEGKNYQYKPGGFGKPPQVVEIGAERPASEDPKSKKKSVTAKGPVIRKAGETASTSSGNKQLPSLGSADSSEDDDAEFEKIYNSISKTQSEALDRFFKKMNEIASAESSPFWSDSL